MTPRVLVVGAGFGGIAAGVYLRRAGIETFTVAESSLGIGGTWWDNTYPGAEVDVGSHLYCFSFKPHDWTRTHARQPELQKYVEETVDEFGLRSHLRLGVTVESAAWQNDRHVWRLRLDDGTVDEVNVLVSAVGFLNVPRSPERRTSLAPVAAVKDGRHVLDDVAQLLHRAQRKGRYPVAVRRPPLCRAHSGVGSRSERRVRTQRSQDGEAREPWKSEAARKT